MGLSVVLSLEPGAAVRRTNSGRQVYASKGFSRRSSMDNRRPNFAAGAAVMTVRTREVGKAWATRSLGIALAVCVSLTVGGDLIVRAAAEPWSGILDPSRAIDWSHAGIPGGIPNRATICASLDPGSTAAQIDAAIAACPPDQVVFLTAGTFTLSAGLNMKSGVTLRGAGANRTKLVFTGTTQCDRGPPPYPVICIKGSFNWAGGVENSADWTAGYAKGATVLTLSNTANLRAGESLLILDQVDDSVDGGDIYNCGVANVCAGEGSDGMRTAPGGYRNQRQIVKVMAINGNQVTISPGLYMPNWRSSQSPQAWWATNPIFSSGVEDLSLDHTGTTNEQAGITIFNCSGCWVKGIRSINSAREHVWIYDSPRTLVSDSYFYGRENAVSQSYGVEAFPRSDSLIESIIFKQVIAQLMLSASC